VPAWLSLLLSRLGHRHSGGIEPLVNGRVGVSRE
jgi:hypothetical protein